MVAFGPASLGPIDNTSEYSLGEVSNDTNELTQTLDGCTCSYIEEWGVRTSAVYSIDHSLSQLTIITEQRHPHFGPHVEAVCSVSEIKDIYCLSEDGVAAFPPEIISNLQPAERELLVVVIVRNDQSKKRNMYLLHESRDKRNIFLEAMKVAFMYAQMFSSIATNPLDEVNVPDQLAFQAEPCQKMCPFFLRAIGIDALPDEARSMPNNPLSPVSPQEVVPYLAVHGYIAVDAVSWGTAWRAGSAGCWPLLEIEISRHIEAAGHTWYILQGSLQVANGGWMSDIAWIAPRRLKHLRHSLHAPIKAMLGTSYAKHFDGVRFPRSGMMGTTTKLQRWFNRLAACINALSVPPLVVALVLHFLEAPCPEESGSNTSRSTRASTVDSFPTIRSEDSMSAPAVASARSEDSMDLPETLDEQPICRRVVAL